MLTGKFKLIFLERTMCEGSCPAYKLRIYPDGKVVYKGEFGVKMAK